MTLFEKRERTDIHTDTLFAILRTPLGGEVIMVGGVVQR